MPGSRRRQRQEIRLEYIAGILILLIVLATLSITQSPFLPAALVILVALGIVGIVWNLWRRQSGQRWQHLRVKTLGELMLLTSTQFEEAVADLLKRQGYTHVQRIGGPGDEGVDIKGRTEDGRPFIVQCKRYAPEKKVRSAEIQGFIGMTYHHRPQGNQEPTYGAFVTTSSFTDAARQIAQKHEHIFLVDGDELTRLLQESQAMASSVTENERESSRDSPTTFCF